MKENVSPQVNNQNIDIMSLITNVHLLYLKTVSLKIYKILSIKIH